MFYSNIIINKNKYKFQKQTSQWKLPSLLPSPLAPPPQQHFANSHSPKPNQHQSCKQSSKPLPSRKTYQPSIAAIMNMDTSYLATETVPNAQKDKHQAHGLKPSASEYTDWMVAPLELLIRVISYKLVLNHQNQMP